jgi:hypothetical protein
VATLTNAASPANSHQFHVVVARLVNAPIAAPRTGPAATVLLRCRLTSAPRMMRSSVEGGPAGDTAQMRDDGHGSAPRLGSAPTIASAAGGRPSATTVGLAVRVVPPSDSGAAVAIDRWGVGVVLRRRPGRLRNLVLVTTVGETVSAVLRGTIGYESGLDALAVAPPAEVDPALTAVLRDACAARWRGGWQPVELHRVVARRGHPTHAQLVTDAVAAHLRQFPPAAVDERWLAQADELGAHVWWRGTATYLDELATRWKSDRVAVLDAVLTLLTILSALPPIEVLVPPPGTAAAPGRGPGTGGSGTGRRGDTRLLDRVRALLAKAESSTYPAEAETYTAKAQELISRHSLDEALAGARAGEAPVTPFARRIGVDHPYEGEKASLLDAIARANHCHTVWSPELGFTTVFGFDTDIDAVDLLHASLLLQAHRAMAQAEPPGGKAGRARLRAFRQSFLVAFAVRIGERLAGAARAALADAARTTGATGAAAAAGLLPVLASRDEEVREAMRSAFPRTVRARGSRVDSREGWDSGRAAADRAALHTGDAKPPE